MPQVNIHILSHLFSLLRLVLSVLQATCRILKPFLIWLELKRKQYLCVVKQSTFSPNSCTPFPIFQYSGCFHFDYYTWARYGRGCFCLLFTSSTLMVYQDIFQSKIFATFVMLVGAIVLDHYVLFDYEANFHLYNQL